MEIINVTNETALPVLNDKRELAGIISEGDLFKLSHIKESVAHTDIGMGGDEDAWTWKEYEILFDCIIPQRRLIYLQYLQKKL